MTNPEAFCMVCQDVGVDICVLSETWLTEGLAQKQMDKVFGSEFIWFGRERKVRKRASGFVMK